MQFGADNSALEETEIAHQPDLTSTAHTDTVQDLLGRTNMEVRPYQQRIVTKALQMFTGEYVTPTGMRYQPASSLMVESPTGSGKTGVGLLIAKALQDIHRERGEIFRVGWIAMRRNLLAQAQSENVKHGIYVDGLQTISMFDKNPPRDLDMLVCDESQHDSTESMSNIYNVINPQYILGLTATPFRMDRMRLCFEHIIKDSGIHALIQAGYLSRYHMYGIDNWQPGTVAEHYLRDREKWGKSVCYFHTLAECFEMHRLLSAAGVRADVVTGDSDRETQLDRFQSVAADSTEIVINCMVLTEGYDFPALRTVFCRPSGKGPTMQMCGRVLRRHESCAFKQIVQSHDTHWPFTRTALAAEQYQWMEDESGISGGWRSLKVNPRLEEITRMMQFTLATTEVTLPKVLTNPVKEPRRRRNRNRSG